MRIWKLLVITMSTCVVFAACGNDSDGEAAATATGEPATEGTEASGESTGSCRDAHESLAEAWADVVSSENELHTGEDDPINFIGKALSACESPDEWLAAAEAAGSIPEPLVPMTGLRFRCDDDPVIFSACGDLVSPEEPKYEGGTNEALVISIICGSAVDAAEAWVHNVDRAAFDEDLARLAELYETAAASDRVALPVEVGDPAERVVTLPTDDPGWGEAFDELVATCNEIGEGGGSF